MAFLIFEIGVILLFILCLYHARRSVKQLALLILASVYAIIFENFNIMLAAGKTGAYNYSEFFSAFVGETPIMIAFAWAVIIYSTYILVNSINIKESRKPFADAFLITLIDIFLDPIATRLGMWSWNNYLPTDGFFGVPGNNFLGWLLVSFVFLFIFRFIDKKLKRARKVLFALLPLISYAVFLLIFGTIEKIQILLKFTKTAELLFFLIIYLIFFFLIKCQSKQYKCLKKEIIFSYITRIFFYCFAISYLILISIYNLESYLIFAFITVVLAEIGFYLRFVAGRCTNF